MTIPSFRKFLFHQEQYQSAQNVQLHFGYNYMPNQYGNDTAEHDLRIGLETFEA